MGPAAAPPPPLFRPGFYWQNYMVSIVKHLIVTIKHLCNFLLLLVNYRYLDKWALTGPGRAGDRWKVLDSGWTLFKAAAAFTQGCWLGTGL